MYIDYKKDIELTKNEFDIVIKTKKDILDELEYDDIDDKFIYNTIVENMESFAAESIGKMKTVSYPNIGCIRINPVHKQFNNTLKGLSVMRDKMTKEEYKLYVGTKIKELRNKEKRNDLIKQYIATIKQKNKDKYDAMYYRFGVAYANMYIKAISLLEEVPYSQEFEDYYRELKNCE